MIGFVTIASAAIASLLGLVVAANLWQQERAQRQFLFVPVRTRSRRR